VTAAAGASGTRRTARRSAGVPPPPPPPPPLGSMVVCLTGHLPAGIILPCLQHGHGGFGEQCR